MTITSLLLTHSEFFCVPSPPPLSYFFPALHLKRGDSMKPVGEMGLLTCTCPHAQAAGEPAACVPARMGRARRDMVSLPLLKEAWNKCSELCAPAYSCVNSNCRPALVWPVTYGKGVRYSSAPRDLPIKLFHTVGQTGLFEWRRGREKKIFPDPKV